MSEKNKTLLVCGRFNSGKSSFINALLGEELLPVGVTPTTAVNTELQYGKASKITAFPSCGNGLKYPVVFNNPTVGDIEKYTAWSKSDFDDEFELPARKFNKVIIEHNNAILKMGFQIVEISPAEYHYGFGGFSPDVLNTFSKADIIIYIMSAIQPNTKEDLLILEQISDAITGELLIVYSGYDMLRRYNKGNSLEIIRKSLLSCIFAKPEIRVSDIFFIDSESALEAKIDSDERLLSTSGIDDIEKKLMKKIENGKQKSMNITTTNEYAISKAFETLERITGTLSDDVASPINLQLLSAKNRFEDEFLNLAVIGDFSCGKSTFLNALFGRDILSTDMQPTTAVPTYIRWNNHGKTFAVIAYDQREVSYDLSTNKGKLKFEKLIGKQLPNNPDKLIDAVTTDNALCQYISKIEIKAPKNNRFPNICLIDTPGVNPGITGTEDHVRVTQNVLRNASDAAIIMFPADKVFTESFKQFLEENANHLLNQSIFVITKSDTAKNDKTRADLVAFVEGHLEKMGVLDPHVFCVSASCALDVYTGTDTSEKCRSFCSQFEETVDSIFGDLARRRSTIVYNNVHSVMEKVSKLLDTEIADTTKALENSRNHMLLYSPENMEKECKELLKEFNSDIGKVKTRYHNNSKDIVGAAIGSCRTTAFASINQKTNKTAVSDYVDQYDERDLYPVISAMTRHLNNLSAELKGKYERYSSDLGSCFRKYQVNIASTNIQNLQTINVEQISTSDVSVSVSGHITGSDIFDGIVDAVDEIFDSDDAFELVGNIAMGALVVAAGAVIGVVNALRSLDSIKEKARNDISAALESNRISLCEKLESNVKAYHEKYKDAAKKLPGQLKSKYHNEYSKAMDKYRKEWADIEKQIEVQKDNLNALNALSKELDLK